MASIKSSRGRNQLIVIVDRCDVRIKPAMSEIDMDLRTWFHMRCLAKDPAFVISNHGIAAAEHGLRVEVLQAVGKACQRA